MLFAFNSYTAIGTMKKCLIKTSASVLLSLFLPKESHSQLEESQFLAHPECLWTVLVVNGCPWGAMSTELSERLTPISQYFRGIAACLANQRLHGEMILDSLKTDLDTPGKDDLFDDENFTKSRLYH